MSNQIAVLTVDGWVRAEFTDGQVAVFHPPTGDLVAAFPSPYKSRELATLKFAQDGAEIYVAHKNHPPHVLFCRGGHGWFFIQAEAA